MSDTQETAPIKAPLRTETRETITFLIKLVIIVSIFRTFFFSAFNIPSESMLPRLLIGDFLFVSKWNYGYSRHSVPFSLPLIPGHIFATLPERGDVAVFKAPPGDSDDYIKRVIGLPGDTIQMRQGQLILNGVPVPKQRIADFTVPITPNYQCTVEFQDSDNGKPICRYPQFRETLPGGRTYNVLDRGTTAADNTGLYTVPADHVFMMGDNRDDSADSRFPIQGQGIGFVPTRNLEGKAVMMFFSTDGTASWFPALDMVHRRALGSGSGALSDSDIGPWLTQLLGVEPGEIALYHRALTHGSQAAANYERLEFLGDRVLGLVIAEWLFDLFTGEPEGQLSKRLNALVTGPVCAGVARAHGVAGWMKLGKQARDDGAADSDNVLGDVMEALIGALYLDHGLPPTRAAIRRLWGDSVTNQARAPQHPKSALQEWAAAHNRRPPDYAIIDRTGPQHAPVFTVRVTIGKLAEASATGNSKQEAETAAAAALLEQLED